jgi:hypothetical protein
MLARAARVFLLSSVLVTALAVPAQTRAPKAARPVGYAVRRPLGVPLHVITVNLRDREVRVSLALSRGGIGTSERFESLIARTGATAALTGTFFSTRTLLPVGDLVSQGRRVHQGGVGTALGITAENGAVFLTLAPGKKADFSQYRLLIRGGPRLVSGGKVAVSLREEGFRDAGFRGRRRRTAAALSEHGKLLLVASAQPVTVTELAKCLRRLGAREAMALDGGSSAALYYRGRTVVSPKRWLTNVIVVYESTRQFMQASDRLVPGLEKQG